MAKREITKVFKVMAKAGEATPGPPLGPALGGNGVNPGQFIQQFNAATQDKKGKVVGCVITVYGDRSFSFEIKSSPASALLKEAAGVDKGSGTPQNRDGGKVSMDQIRSIATEKMADLNAASVESAMRMIEGTARSMGIVVEGA
ncbi:MAG: 50S ribosomal protein L11 [Phycisphaerales bacterium]|nr:50S ribosomal protein L11 [Phycisphaerales bacterium]